MARSIRTPWKHDSDLALVRDWLFPQHAEHDLYLTPTPSDTFPDTQTNRALATTKIRVWQMKGPVPHPIVATSELTEAQLTYSYSKVHPPSLTSPSSALISDYAIKATLSTAFNRFVNGFVDKDANSAESSMYATAAKIGMPRSFVDLRHRATHGRELPSLVELVRMADEALEWLWGYWWVGNAKGDSGRAIWERQELEKKINEAEERWEMKRLKGGRVED